MALTSCCESAFWRGRCIWASTGSARCLTRRFCDEESTSVSDPITQRYCHSPSNTVTPSAPSVLSLLSSTQCTRVDKRNCRTHWWLLLFGCFCFVFHIELEVGECVIIIYIEKTIMLIFLDIFFEHSLNEIFQTSQDVDLDLTK